MKVVLRYSESTSGPIIKPQWPFVYDLIDDPNEEWDLIDRRLDCAWVLHPVAEKLGSAHAERRAVPEHRAWRRLRRLLTISPHGALSTMEVQR